MGKNLNHWGKLYQIRLSHSSETWKFIDKTLRDIKNIKEFPSLKNGVLQEGEKLEVYEIKWDRFSEGTTFIFRDDKLSSVFMDVQRRRVIHGIIIILINDPKTCSVKTMGLCGKCRSVELRTAELQSGNRVPCKTPIKWTFRYHFGTLLPKTRL